MTDEQKRCSHSPVTIFNSETQAHWAMCPLCRLRSRECGSAGEAEAAWEYLVTGGEGRWIIPLHREVPVVVDDLGEILYLALRSPTDWGLDRWWSSYRLVRDPEVKPAGYESYEAPAHGGEISLRLREPYRHATFPLNRARLLWALEKVMNETDLLPCAVMEQSEDWSWGLGTDEADAILQYAVLGCPFSEWVMQQEDSVCNG